MLGLGGRLRAARVQSQDITHTHTNTHAQMAAYWARAAVKVSQCSDIWCTVAKSRIAYILTTYRTTIVEAQQCGL